ncbi:ACR3 family arsenite efflux transporter [Cloacibacillus evryensis]|uniref:ACR3 family arsenite efflux transporter n=1 Tax=Cloacibacillus evryensis TaxID=508460 RepID=UPI003AB2C082
MAEKRNKDTLGIFGRWLTLWVALCMAVGVGIGVFLPRVPAFLAKFEYANVSIPVAVLIWLMIYPMMLKIDFSSIVQAVKMPKGLIITCVTNWLVKPFTMYAAASFFFFTVYAGLLAPESAREYLAGAVLLGAAPCTAMVFVWSQLTNGNPAYTLVQVAVNDLIILAAFTPITAFLLGVSGIAIPWNTLLLSVILFVLIPLTAGWLTRKFYIAYRGERDFYRFIKKFEGITTAGLLLTLIIIFSFQGKVILENPVDILLIALPLTLQTFFIFAFGYLWAKLWKLPYDIAAPAGLIGASNFFELAVAVAISLFGLQSGAALATVVGVLIEVPVMLMLVNFCNRTKDWFLKKPVIRPQGR